MMRSRVDLPEPLGPRSAVSEPLSTSTETSSTATKSPNCFETLRTWMDIYAIFSFGRIAVIATRTMIAIVASTIEMAYAPAMSNDS